MQSGYKQKYLPCNLDLQSIKQLPERIKAAREKKNTFLVHLTEYRVNEGLDAGEVFTHNRCSGRK